MFEPDWLYILYILYIYIYVYMYGYTMLYYICILNMSSLYSSFSQSGCCKWEGHPWVSSPKLTRRAFRYFSSFHLREHLQETTVFYVSGVSYNSFPFNINHLTAIWRNFHPSVLDIMSYHSTRSHGGQGAIEGAHRIITSGLAPEKRKSRESQGICKAKCVGMRK